MPILYLAKIGNIIHATQSCRADGTVMITIPDFPRLLIGFLCIVALVLRARWRERTDDDTLFW